MRNQSGRLSALALVLMWSALGGGGAWAQSSIPREETWVTNGSVSAIVRTADTVYIGGRFTYVGPSTGTGVPIDTASGQPAATFPPVTGTVFASIPDGAGGWYIGGQFTQVGGARRFVFFSRLRALKPDRRLAQVVVGVIERGQPRRFLHDRGSRRAAPRLVEGR